MDTGPKHRLVGNGTEMVHRTGFMLKRTFRYERCQEHLSNSETSVIDGVLQAGLTNGAERKPRGP